jgi:hypothetical protein
MTAKNWQRQVHPHRNPTTRDNIIDNNGKDYSIDNNNGIDNNGKDYSGKENFRGGARFTYLDAAEAMGVAWGEEVLSGEASRGAAAGLWAAVRALS